MNLKIGLLAGLFSLPVLVSAQTSQGAKSRQADSSSASASIVIHQEVDYTVSPNRLYEVLLSTKKFREMTSLLSGFTATSATIDSALGGACSVFDGHIVARNVELVPNKRIVQAWRVVTWPEGVWSIARFEFRQQGNGTHLVFDHIGFPEGLREHLTDGWKEHYFDALRKYVK